MTRRPQVGVSLVVRAEEVDRRQRLLDSGYLGLRWMVQRRSSGVVRRGESGIGCSLRNGVLNGDRKTAKTRTALLCSESERGTSDAGLASSASPDVGVNFSTAFRSEITRSSLRFVAPPGRER